MRAALTRRVILAALAVLAGAAPSWAKQYAADRFDVRAFVLADRSIVVDELVVFRFDGQYSYVTREIPSTHTDGIVDVVAGLDGVMLPPGTGPGHVELKHGSSFKVTWRFTPLDGTHAFTLHYRLVGAASREHGADRVSWYALPTQHGYRVDRFSALLVLPSQARPLAAPRVSPANRLVTLGERQMELGGEALGPNDSVRIDWELAPGALVAETPGWQRAEEQRRAFGPWLLLVSLAIVIAGIGWLAVVLTPWVRDREPTARVESAPPDAELPLAMAARLGTSHPSAVLAGAALVELATRGVIAFHGQARAVRLLGTEYIVRLVNEPATLLPHQRALLDLAFGTSPRSAEVKWSTLQRRLASSAGSFSRALSSDMRKHGLIDPDRVAVRKLLIKAAIILFGLAAASVVLVILLARVYGAWAATIPAALGLVALAALIASATFSVFSQAGARESYRWRSFFGHVKKIGKGRGALVDAWLPLAVAAGAGKAWAKRMTAEHGLSAVPAWYRLAGTEPDDFVGFMASIGAAGAHGDAHGGHGAGAAAGAAGGGSSGAG